MKKYMTLLFALLLTFALCACGSPELPDPQPGVQDPTQEDNGKDPGDQTQGAIIPEGGRYILADGTRLDPGTPFPAVPAAGDAYRYGDYEYRYGQERDSAYKWQATDGHWSVVVRDNMLESYGQILPEVMGLPVTSMSSTFLKCKQLTQAPTIPETVTNLSHCFSECVALTTPPAIPDGVTNMVWCFADCAALTSAPELPSAAKKLTSTFRNCVSLTEAPQIPENVVRLSSMFEGCTNLAQVDLTIPESVKEIDRMFYSCIQLSGTITIHAEPVQYTDCFYWVDFDAQGLTVTGSTSLLKSILSTGK